jgi:hypothetical protein
MEKTSPKILMNDEQVRNLLTYIDGAIDETAKKAIFSRLGEECFRCGHSDQWIDSFKGDIKRFLDNVNVDHASRYWEKLELTNNNTRLILTGREVDRCVCSLAGDGKAPRALCSYCCTTFQKELFGYLFGKTVEVRITESFLNGQKRCSTVVDIL